MTTLFATMVNLMRLLPGKLEGVATAGGATSLTYGSNTVEADDWFNKGLVCNITKSASAAITDFAQTNGVITVATQNPVWAASDKFVAVGPAYNKSEILSAINSALKEFRVNKVDVSLTTATNTESYTLPAGVTDVLRVEIATSSSAPYVYAAYPYGYHAIGGTLYIEGKLPDTGMKLRLIHAALHDDVYLDADVINDDIDPVALAQTAFYYLLQTRVQQIENSNSFSELEKMLQTARNTADRMNLKRPVKLVKRQGHMSGW